MVTSRHSLPAPERVKVKNRVYEILEAVRPDDRTSRTINAFILLLIVLNIIALVVETVPRFHDAAPRLFSVFELVSVLVFSLEYVLRLWSCTASQQYTSPVRGRFRFALKPLVLIDLLAFLPFYVSALVIDLRFVRIVRMVRLFRVAKLARYSRAMQTIGRVMVAKKEELVRTLMVLGVLLMLASSLTYYAEHDAQPEAFSSIPAAIW